MQGTNDTGYLKVIKLLNLQEMEIKAWSKYLKHKSSDYRANSKYESNLLLKDNTSTILW